MTYKTNTKRDQTVPETSVPFAGHPISRPSATKSSTAAAA